MPNNPNAPPPPPGKAPKKKPPQPDNSSIQMLNKQLYAREEPQEVERRVKKLSTPAVPAVRPFANEVAQPSLVDVARQRQQRRKKAVVWGSIIAAVILVFAGAVAGTMWYRSSRQVSQAQLGITVNAPAEFTAGEVITYAINYQNNSRVRWDNVELLFDPPVGFQLQTSEPAASPSGRQLLFSLGSLAPKQQGQVTISGQLIGEQRSNALARIELAISPENFPKARITKSETFSTEIVAVPLEVAIEAASEAADKERVRTTIRVKNTSAAPITGGILRIASAVGLELAPEDPEFTEGFSVPDSWWELPLLQPGEEVTRTLILHVAGQAGERRTLEVESILRHNGELFVQRTVNHVLVVSAAEIVVEQAFNGEAEDQVVTAGQDVAGTVTYQNVGTTGLRNVIVSVKFEGTGLDASQLKLSSGGSYDPIARTITWTTASVPELATVLPGQQGTLEYEFAIQPTSVFPTTDEGKNQSLIAVAVIDSPDLPTPVGQERKVISDRVVLPIGTELTLTADAFYDDGRLGLTSVGPLPPVVGEQTTYTVRFRLGSTFNDVGEARLTAVLPDGVQYLDKVYKTAGEVEYNERTGEVTWTVAQIEGQAGRLKPAPELHVHVGITPGENLRGQVVPLVQSVTANAFDLYTDQSVELEATQLPTTETASRGQGKVQ